jgi:hypothetical protein
MRTTNKTSQLPSRPGKKLTGMDRDCQDQRKAKVKRQRVKVKADVPLDAVLSFTFCLLPLSCSSCPSLFESDLNSEACAEKERIRESEIEG